MKLSKGKIRRLLKKRKESKSNNYKRKKGKISVKEEAWWYCNAAISLAFLAPKSHILGLSNEMFFLSKFQLF